MVTGWQMTPPHRDQVTAGLARAAGRQQPQLPRARCTAEERSRTWSLPWMLRMCVLTVFTETDSAPAAILAAGGLTVVAVDRNEHALGDLPDSVRR
jgi:hypothetical protein